MWSFFQCKQSTEECKEKHQQCINGEECKYLYWTIRVKQIIKYNRWQQRNEPIIHNVTSVKYNKENEIVSHLLTCFPRLNKV